MDVRNKSNLKWLLKKYARFEEPRVVDSMGAAVRSDHSHGEWSTYDSVENPPCLVLTDTPNLIVLHGDRIQENYSLAEASDQVRGVSRADTLLLLIKLKDSTRRFRVQFSDTVESSAAQQLDQCVQHLSKHIHIKHVPVEEDARPDNDSARNLPIPTMAKILTSDASTSSLSNAYQQADIEAENLDMLIRLCLTDSTFPALVASIQDKMEDIVEEGPRK